MLTSHVLQVSAPPNNIQRSHCYCGQLLQDAFLVCSNCMQFRYASPRAPLTGVFQHRKPYSNSQKWIFSNFPYVMRAYRNILFVNVRPQLTVAWTADPFFFVIQQEIIYFFIQFNLLRRMATYVSSKSYLTLLSRFIYVLFSISRIT